MKRDRILLAGARGQLGETLANLHMQSPLNLKYELIPLDSDGMNLINRSSIKGALSKYSPSVIINCAAYTFVDKAEEEPSLSKKINDEAVDVLAKWSNDNQCRLIQISTDYVFDGNAQQPYSPNDETKPLSVYGSTKLAGERHVLGMNSRKGVVIRTSWLYSMFGNNFVKSMLRLMGEREELSIVEDQIGSPTSTHSLVKVLVELITNCNLSGVFHWNDGGSISWYDFALEIQKQAYDQGVLKRKIPIQPIKTSAFPTNAIRPAYSVLDRRRTLEELNINPSNWKIELRRVLEEISSSQRNFDE